jgi:hypothetical protein
MGPIGIDAVTVSLWPDQPGIYLRTASGPQKEPQLCFGDSGGPVTIDRVPGSSFRKVVAVNSGLGAQPDATQKAPAFYSYLAPLNSRAFRDLLKGWADSGVPDALPPRARIICGYNRPAAIQGCRG